MRIKKPQFDTCWIDSRIEIRNSRIHGRGMFAKENIDESEKIVIWGGLLMNKKEIELAKHRSESAVQVTDDLYIAEPVGTPDGLDDFINHSCNPNLWMEDEYMLIARWDIKKGEELTIDYALFLSEPDWKMKCLCGAENCRGLVAGNDWKLKELQYRYKNYFSPYLNEKIKKLNG